MPFALHPIHVYLPFSGRTFYTTYDELRHQISRNVDASVSNSKATPGTQESQKELLELIQPLLELHDMHRRESERRARIFY